MIHYALNRRQLETTGNDSTSSWFSVADDSVLIGYESVKVSVMEQ